MLPRLLLTAFLLIFGACGLVRASDGVPSALFAVLRPFNTTHRIAKVPDLANHLPLSSSSWECRAKGFSCTWAADGISYVSRRAVEDTLNQSETILLQAELVPTLDIGLLPHSSTNLSLFIYFLNNDGLLSAAADQGAQQQQQQQFPLSSPTFLPALMDGGSSTLPDSSSNSQLTIFSTSDGSEALSRGRRVNPTGTVTFVSPQSRLLTIPETATIGTVLTTVVAISNLALPVTYSMDFGASFSVDSAGRVSLAASITGWNKQQPVRLVVRAADGAGVLATSAFLELIATVEDLNYPYFVDAQGVRTSTLAVSLPRDSSVGTSAVLVAFDDDQPSPSALQFSLTCTSSTQLALSTSGTLSLLQTIATVVQITDCSIHVVDSTNPQRNSTTSLLFLPTSMYVRTSLALCGVSSLGVTAALEAAISTALTLNVNIITNDPYTSNACTGRNIQLQAYCYTAGACASIASSFAATPLSSSFWVSVGLSTTTSVVSLLAPTIIQPSGPTPSYQCAPVVTNANTYQNFATPVTVASLVSATGVDFDNTSLSIAVSNIFNSGPNSGAWVIQNSSGNVMFTFSTASNAQSVYLQASDSILFQRTAGFHGLVSFDFKLYKATTNMTSGTIIDTTAFTSYGMFSTAAVTAVGLIFPPPLTSPTSATTFTLPPINIQSGVATAFGTQVSNLITGSLVVDASIASNLPGAPSALLALVSSTEQARYTAAVARFNTVSSRRAMLLASRGSVGIAIVGNNDNKGTWQLSTTADHRYWTELSSFAPLSPSKALLLSFECALRFTPSSSFSGTATLSVMLWDGSEGLSGTTTSTLISPGSFSNATRSIVQVVTRQNTRPKVHTVSYSLPTIAYTYLETNQFVTVFTINELLTSFTPRTAQFINLLSVLISTRTQQIRILERNSKVELALQCWDLATGNMLRAVDVITRFQSSQLITSGGHFPFVVLSASVLDFPVNFASALNPSTFPRNTGLSISQITAAVSSDVDSANTLGLAITLTSSTPNTTGSWLYRLSSMAEWASIPPSSTQRAFLLPASASIRFAPVEKYLGSSSLQAYVWDQTSFTVGSFQNVLSNSITSTFSERAITLVSQRAGCDGVANSQASFDACGTCTTSNNFCTSGVVSPCLAGVTIDGCGVCGGNGTTCAGCNNVPYSGLGTDNCGVCVGTGMAQDCNGDCFGSAFVDACGVCVGGLTNRTPLATKDCAGVCGGTAVIDECGDCALGTTTRLWNQAMDCRGACGGAFVLDGCGICKDPASTASMLDCAGVCFGSSVVDDCGVCVPSRTSPAYNANKDACSVCFGNGQSCLGCDMVANSGQIIDECGVCGGTSACLRLSTVTPDSAAITGGTVLSLFGSGYTSSPNAVCKFRQVVGSSTTLYMSPITVTNRSRATCTSPVSTVLGTFSLSVSIDGSTNSNSQSFVFYTLSGVTVTSLSFTEALITDTTPLVFHGTSFYQTNRPTCYYPEFSASLPYTGTFISATSFSCPVPVLSRSMTITPSISFNGVYSQAFAGPVVTFYTSSAVLTSASFNGAATQLFVTWNRALNITPFATTATTNSNNGSSACNLLFDTATARLLGSSTCSFISFETLLITLTGDARVFMGTRLTVKRNAIFVKDENFSRPCFGSITVQALASPLVPTAVIQVPQAFSTCGGNLTISGRFSSGGGYAQLRFKFWVQSPAFVRPIEALLAAAGPLTDTIGIPSTLFTAGQTYFFFLQVTNILGYSSTVVRSRGTTVFSSVTLPSYQILGNPFQASSVEQPSSVASAVRSPACYQLDPLSFAYTVDRCVDMECNTLTFVNKIVLLSNRSGVAVNFGALALPPDARYRVQQFLTNNNGTARNDVLTTSAVLSVQRTPLTCSILGGGRTVSSFSSFTLQVYPSDASVAAAVQWSCQRADGVACSNSLLAVQPTTSLLTYHASFGASLTVPANTLRSGSYMFTATLITTTSPLVTCSTWVAANTSAQPPNVYIQPLREPVVSTSPTLISAWISSSVLCSYRWTCATKGNQFCPPAVPLSGNTSVGATLSPAFLPLPMGSLTPNLPYTFLLTATCSGIVASATIDVIAGSVPTGGSLVVSNGSQWSPSSAPIVGRALFTNFTIEAIGWSDVDAALPLRYALAINHDGRRSPVVLTPFSLEPSFSVWLPMGLAARNYAVDITMIVENARGSQTNITTQAIVLPWYYFNTTAGQALFAQSMASLRYYGDWSQASSLCAAVALSGLTTNISQSLCTTFFDSMIASSTFFFSSGFTPVHATILRDRAPAALLSLVNNTQLVDRVLPTSLLASSALSELRAREAVLVAISELAAANVTSSLATTARAALALGAQYCASPSTSQAFWNFGTLLMSISVLPQPRTQACANISCSGGLFASSLLYSTIAANNSCLNPSLYACQSPCFLTAQVTSVPSALSQFASSTHIFNRISDVVLQYQFSPNASISSTNMVPATTAEFVFAASSVSGTLRCCVLASPLATAWTCTNAPTSAQNAPRDGVTRYVVQCATGASTVVAVFQMTPIPTTPTSTTSTTRTSTTSTTLTTTQTTTRTSTSTSTTSTTRRTSTSITTTATTTPVQAIAITATGSDQSSLVAWILVPLASLAMLVVLLYFARKYKSILKVSSTKDVPLTPDLHPSYTKVILFNKTNIQHELEDFHLPLSARLQDARQALKTALPQGMLVYFLTADMTDVSLLVEGSTTVGEIMKDGTLFIRDVTGLENTKRQFCTCGSVADYECSRCENQGYCSEVCQRKHWTLHARLCFPAPRRPPSLAQPPRPLFQKRMAPAPIRPRVSIATQNLESSSDSEVDEKQRTAKRPPPPRTIQGHARGEPIAIPVTLPSLVATEDDDSDHAPSPRTRASAPGAPRSYPIVPPVAMPAAVLPVSPSSSASATPPSAAAGRQLESRDV
eukprot:m.147511 g.147511  ORF g.147511 m.147511 type:complete len:2896 (+) comp15040_c5_seq2:160-8847(+)